MGQTQTNITWIYICLIAFIGILFFFPIPANAKVKGEDLEGYEVDFDYSGREKEVEIVYQYHISNFPRDKKALKREYIEVDLYDIDNDGKKEIIYMIYGTPEAGYCGNRGCTFNILKQSGKRDQQGNPVYVPIRWDPDEKNLGGLSINKIKILNTTTLGVHDLLLDTDVIWKWQETYYDYYKNINE